MRCIVKYEIESDTSVVSDEIPLIIQHPNGLFQARIKNILRTDFSTPFLLSLQITFEAPSLQEARKIADGKLVECLNMLAFVTGAGVRLHRTRQIADCTPSSGMNDCLIWADTFGHEDPNPFFDESIAASIEHLLNFDPPPAVARALRWYRIGIYEPILEDKFQYFWFALEILAEHQKSPGKVNDKCPRCKSSLYCETCKTHPTHKPYAKQAIFALIQTVDKKCDDETLVALDKTRNGLMHGATLEEIEHTLSKSIEDIVDVLGRILFKALAHQFPTELFNKRVHFGYPSTYIHRTVEGIAHAKTALPKGENGEIDLDIFTGLTFSMVTKCPPQSGLPSIIVMSPDQHKQIGLLMRNKGSYTELCKRIYEGAKIEDGRIIALVLATDMKQICEAIKRHETADWVRPFIEILHVDQFQEEL